MAIFGNGHFSTNGGGKSYDRVVILSESGEETSYARPAYEKLPLAERIRPMLQGRTRFFLAGQEVDARQALKGG